MVIVVPALIIGFVCAPYGLALFGRRYVAGTLTPLRWLVFAGFITMLNYVTGAILFIAKKSAMITIVNVVDAVIVLGLVLLWATNVTQIAIAWVVGDVGNTLLFGFFAFVALREVGGRWEDLGGGAPSSAAQVPTSLSATSQLRALGLLATLAEQQNAVDMYKPYHNSLTDSQGLFSIAALQAAERQRQRFLNESEARRNDAPKTPDESAAAHQQSFELLFKMAERQRATGLTEPAEHPRMPGYAWPDERADPRDQGK